MSSHHTNTLTHQHTLRACWCVRCRYVGLTLALPGAACRGLCRSPCSFPSGCSLRSQSVH